MTDQPNAALGAAEPVMLAAFEGWNDAGSAASGALDHLHQVYDAVQVVALDPEEYHDFQVTRPAVSLDGDRRRITWQQTTVARADIGGRPVLLVHGIEPSMRWRRYCRELLDLADRHGVRTVVVVGALLADVPHTRPIPVTVTSEDAELRARLDVEASTYEGPVGIVGVLQQEAHDRGLACVAVWAAVPHYVAHPPSPKATLAVLGTLERLLGTPLPLADLAEDALAWQRGVDELAAEDTEIAEYVRRLEEAKDTVDLPEASGEAIAQEFERYLRRRDLGSGG